MNHRVFRIALKDEIRTNGIIALNPSVVYEHFPTKTINKSTRTKNKSLILQPSKNHHHIHGSILSPPIFFLTLIPYVVNLSSVVRVNFSQRDRVQDQTIRNDEQMQPRLENWARKLGFFGMFYITLIFMRMAMKHHH